MCHFGLKSLHLGLDLGCWNGMGLELLSRSSIVEESVGVCILSPVTAKDDLFCYNRR